MDDETSVPRTVTPSRDRHALVLAALFLALSAWSFAERDVARGAGLAGVAVLWLIWFAVRRHRAGRRPSARR